MMRALWTAASGMVGQQTNLDTISNNLANINTTGYKTQAANFKSLIYQNIQKKSTTTTGESKPVGAQVGLGVRVGSITASFTQGILNASSGQFDYAIEGDGFFMIKQSDGSTAYTRNGHFNMSINADGSLSLTDSSGCPVLDKNGQPVVLSSDYKSSKIQIDMNGNITYPNATGNRENVGIQIGLVRFPNAAGLTKSSETNFVQSEASGVPTTSTAYEMNSKIVSGYLEGSNVSAADEMVNMIIAQRAYEMNSKAIKASDEMLQQANNLRG